MQRTQYIKHLLGSIIIKIKTWKYHPKNWLTNLNELKHQSKITNIFADASIR